MSKSLLYIQARQLRSKGESVKNIASKLGVTRGTASHWVRDMVLTVEQLEKLRQSSIKGAELGRLRGALVQKARRAEIITKAERDGIERLSNIKQREFLIAGIALYWGEGCKKTTRMEFCNSDPRMVKFLTLWLKECLGVKEEDIRCRVGINISHLKREAKVKEYWSNITGIPLKRFSKTSFKKVSSQKIYSNFEDHYGTLTVMVSKGATYYYKIIGLIEGLYLSKFDKDWQRSSGVRADDS